MGALGLGDVDEYGRPIVKQPVIPPPEPGIAPTAQFSPAQINIPGPGPAESVMTNLLNRAPRPEEFHRSTGSKILDAIAAGLAGASGGAKMGLQVADELNPYTQAKHRWQDQIEALNPQVQMEQQRYTRGVEAAKLGTTQQDILAQQEAARAKAAEQHNVEEERTRHDKAMEVYNQARANKKSPIEIEMDLARADPDFYKRFNEARHPHETLEQTIAKVDAEAKVRLKYAAPTAAAAERGRQSEKPTEDYSSLIANARALAGGNNPAALEAYIKTLPVKARTAVLSEVPLEHLVAPQDRPKLTNANISLRHVQSLREMLKDPYISSHLGPIVGRIESAEGRIGGKPSGTTPDEIRKEQQFLNFINMAMTWEASVFGSNRPSWQLIQQLKSQGIKTALSPDRFAGALDAMEMSAHNTIGGVLGGGPTTGTGSFDWNKLQEHK